MLKMPEFKAERVWLAPMSGSTDAAFRRQAVKFGAPAVVSEMVAGEALIASRPDMVRKMCRHDGEGLWIVQLAARRPEDMRAGAALLADLGVDVIDINMGCPSRQVTGGKSGSALMKEPDLALKIIDSALEGAGSVPVTLKMRLGWDESMLNAPMIGQAAEDRGIQLLTIHGRTRCQFYKGQADWVRIEDTVNEVHIPVVANGDISSVKDAHSALKQSGAFGVMVGRSAMGQPWLVGEIASALAGKAYKRPSLNQQLESLIEQIEDSLDLYGDHLGLRIVRKHVAACIDRLQIEIDDVSRKQLRSRLCQIENPNHLIKGLRLTYAVQPEANAA